MLNSLDMLIHLDESGVDIIGFRPGDTLPAGFGEGWALLLDHTHQCGHHPSLQQLHQPLLHIGWSVLSHTHAQAHTILWHKNDWKQGSY